MKAFISLICMLSLLASCSSKKDEEAIPLLPELLYLNMEDVQAPLSKYDYITDITKEDSTNINLRTGEIEHFYTTNKYGKKFVFILIEKDSMITGVGLRSNDFSDLTELENFTSEVKAAVTNKCDEPLSDSGFPKNGERLTRTILWDFVDTPLLVASNYKELSFSLQCFVPKQSFDE